MNTGDKITQAAIVSSVFRSSLGQPFTYRELLEALKSLTSQQLGQEVLLLPPQPDGTKPTLLEPVVCIGTIKELCHVEEEIGTQTRSGLDFAHHPEQVVLLRDESPYDEDGNTMFTIEEKGWRGNKTGKLYEFGSNKVIDEG